MEHNGSGWNLDTTDAYFSLVTTEGNLSGYSENKQKGMAS